jgi:hypothetical protein
MFSPFTCFKHLDIDCIYQPDTEQFGVFASEEISPGSVLIIEKGLFETTDLIIDCILKHRELYDLAKQLYPRVSTNCFYSEIQQKISYNSWDWDVDNKIALFYSCSMFNHSCEPNAAIVECNSPVRYNEGFTFCAIIATQRIKKGDEICIMYDTNAGHNHSKFNWNCNCGCSLKQRRFNFNDSLKLSKYFKKENLEWIHNQMISFEIAGKPIQLEQNIKNYFTRKNITLTQNEFKTIYDTPMELEDTFSDLSLEEDKNENSSEMLSYALSIQDDYLIVQYLQADIKVEYYDVDGLIEFMESCITQSIEYQYIVETVIQYSIRNKRVDIFNKAKKFLPNSHITKYCNLMIH